MLKKEKFMKEAIKQAKKAYDKEEIPVGAVIVKDGKIIAITDDKGMFLSNLLFGGFSFLLRNF